MNSEQVNLVEHFKSCNGHDASFEYKNKNRNAFMIEGRIVWKHQSYLDFLEINQDFYGGKGQDNAKRAFWLKCPEVHHKQAFRAKMLKGKPIYVNRQVQPSETPCKWEIKIYTRELDYPITLWKSFYDHDSVRTIENFLLKEVFGRIDPNGQIKRQYPEQTFNKALIFDRETDEIVFQYPAQGFMILDIEESRKELLRVCKHFKEKECFPPQEHYSLPDLEEQEFKSTPKVFKEDKNDYSHIFLQMKEALYSECARLNLTEYIVNVADLTFISFSQNYLAVSASAMKQKEKRETFLSVLNQFYKRFFGENVQIGYKKKEAIQSSETQPKTTETQKVEVEVKKVIKTPKGLKSKSYFKNPDKVFENMMIEFFRTISENPIEFEKINFKWQDTETMCVYFTVPAMELVELCNESEHANYFRLLVIKHFDSSYQIRLRHEDIAADWIPTINRI